MAYIKIDLNGILMDGHNVTFKAPCDCTAIDGLRVCYIENSTLKEKIFTMKDAHGNTLTGLGNLFEEGAYVHAILDTENMFAYLQNADTNGYLEGNFKNTLKATYKATINRSANFDTLKDGIYYINTWAGSGGLNFPTTQGSGMLFQFSSESIITQFAFYTNGINPRRTFSNGEWSDWAEN